MEQDRLQACKEWIARQTAKLDQLEKQFEAQYSFLSPECNRERLDDIEAARFWIEIHNWELNQMIESGDDYPQRSSND